MSTYSVPGPWEMLEKWHAHGSCARQTSQLMEAPSPSESGGSFRLPSTRCSREPLKIDQTDTRIETNL